MTPEQFCYWLQGFAELNTKMPPNPTQWRQIQDHLNTVFTKVTPSYPTINPVNPMNPLPYPFMPNTGPWISPTTPGTRPEVICSVSPNSGAYSTSGSVAPSYSLNFSGTAIKDLK